MSDENQTLNFKDLSRNLMLALALVEKLEAGEKSIEDEAVRDFLTFRVGYALREVFRLTKEDPTGTLVWIKEISRSEDN